MLPTASEDNDIAQRLRSLHIDRSENARSGSWARWLGLALLLSLIAGAAIFLSARGGSLEQTAQPPTVAADTAPSDPAPPPQSVWTVAGYLVARRQSLVSAEVTAKVTALLVAEGSVVREGQAIAHLDGTLAKADLRIAKARADVAVRTVEAVLAELGEAKRVLKRTRSLSIRSISSAADLSKAETQVAALTAKHLEAQAKRKIAAREAERAAAVVDKHTITAPFPGAVTGCTAQVGETISPMSSGGSIRNGICTIVDTDSIEIELDVPETMISRVRLGAKARAFLDAYPSDALTATVRAISPTANREKSTIKVRLGFEEADTRLRPNMAIKVRLRDLKTGSER